MRSWLCVALVAVLSLASADNCAPGGVFDEQFNKCYHYFTTIQSYTEAQEVCEGIDGRLVTIKNAFQETYIFGNAHRHFASDYWIGLAALDEPNKWVWSDDTTSPFTYWAPGYPIKNDTLRCAAASSDNGKWYNRECDKDGEGRYFICEVEMRPDVPSDSCPGRGLLFESTESRCYYFFDSMQSYADALVTCRNLEGYIANLIDEARQEAVFRGVEVRSFRSDTWLGLTEAEDYYEDWSWTWSNYSTADYKNWELDFPIEDAGMYCAAMLQTNGKWYNALCTDEHAFICETRTSVPSSLPPVTVTPEPWLYYPPTKSYYKILSYTPNEWSAYIDICEKAGGKFASIHSSGENAFIRGLADHDDVDNVWIGLHDENQSGNFTWVDGTSVDYVNWQAGDPRPNYYCAAMKMDGSWTNLNCLYQYYVAVCKKPA